MSARVQINGLPSLRQALQQLPQELAQEAHAIVQAHAEGAARDIQQGYPEGPTGNLRRGVTTQVNMSRFGGAAVVRSRARHSTIFEKGTGRRQTARGWNRGVMPAASRDQQMVPKAIEWRRRMNRALIDLLRRNGLEVNADA